MINRRRYYKANDKKVLHKIHKRWVIVSLAMLGAIGLGGAMFTNSPAHAANVNGPSTATTQAQSSPKAAQSAPTATSTATTANTAPQHQAVPAANENMNKLQATPQMQQNTSPVNVASHLNSAPVSHQITSNSSNNTAQNSQPLTSHTLAVHQNTASTVPKADAQISQANSEPVLNRSAIDASQGNNQAKFSASTSTSISNSHPIKSSEVLHNLDAAKSSDVQLQQASNVQHREAVAAKAALAQNSWGNLKNRGLNLSESENMKSRNALNRQKQLNKVLQQNSWNGDLGADLNMNKDLGDSNDPTIHVDGDSVTFNGNAELHFYNNKNQDIKDLTVPYSTTSEVGDTATILDPNDFLNKTIQGFNTTGYHAVGGAPIIKAVTPDDVPTGAEQAVITNNYGFNYMSDTPAQPTLDTDIIHYVYNGGSVGKTTVSGQPGAQTTVTGAGLDPGYKLTNDGSQSFNLDNGVHNVDVTLAVQDNNNNNNNYPNSNNNYNPSNVPQKMTDAIYYIYDGNDEGSTTMTGTAGTQAAANGSNMPNGFRMTDIPMIPFDGNAHSVDVEPISTNNSNNNNGSNTNGNGTSNNNNNNIVPNGPTINNNGTNGNNGANENNEGNSGTAINPDNPASPDNQMDMDQINYMYQGTTKGSTVMRGKNGISTSADGNGMPSGFKLAGDGTQSFVFDNGTHNVDIVPTTAGSVVQDDDTLNFLDNGVLKGSTTKRGTDKMTGVVQQGDIPGGYELAPNTPNTFTFDNGIHNISVAPIPTSVTPSSTASNTAKNNTAQTSGSTSTAVGQDEIVINYVNSSTGQNIDHTVRTGANGSQFNYQDYENMAPQGYQFQRIVNPITNFAKESQTMWIYVVPTASNASTPQTGTNTRTVIDTGTNTANTTNTSNTTSSNAANNGQIPNGSFNNDIINGNGAHNINNNTNGAQSNGSSSNANTTSTSRDASDAINSLVSSTEAAREHSLLNNPDYINPGYYVPPFTHTAPQFQLTPSENRNHSYLEGYQDAVNHHRINPSDYGYDSQAYDTGFDDGISHLLHEHNKDSNGRPVGHMVHTDGDYNVHPVRNGHDYDNGYYPTGNYGIGTDTGTGAEAGAGGYGTSFTGGYSSPSPAVGSPVGNVIDDIGSVAQDEADADSPEDGAAEPEPGSNYDGYTVYEDEIGVYIIVNGIKIYWDAQTQSFDLVWSSSQNTLIPYVDMYGTQPNI